MQRELHVRQVCEGTRKAHVAHKTRRYCKRDTCTRPRRRMLHIRHMRGHTKDDSAHQISARGHTKGDPHLDATHRKSEKRQTTARCVWVVTSRAGSDSSHGEPTRPPAANALSLGRLGRERKTDRQTDRQIDRQTDRQTGRQTDRQTDRQR
jgi:hypothetical protein